MFFLVIVLSVHFIQSPAIVSKNSGDEIRLNNYMVFQENLKGAAKQLKYAYRGDQRSIEIQDLKRITLKETLKRKKGIATFRAVLVKKDNVKLEITIDLVRIEGIGENGKEISINFSSVDKISF